MTRPVLGLDVGGANLKAAHSGGGARSRPFALWKSPAGLADALRPLLRDWPPYELLALTMTGELCDCFATTREVYLMLGHLPEDPDDCDTADGRPATRACAEARVARMICADLETSTADERHHVARRICTKQTKQIGERIELVARSLPRPPK